MIFFLFFKDLRSMSYNHSTIPQPQISALEYRAVHPHFQLQERPTKIMHQKKVSVR